MIVTLAGGVGAARFLAGLARAVPPAELTAVVNVGDDLELHGLHVSPDLDTVTYTLAGAINPETSWGLAGETWRAMGALGRYGGLTWFNLGDLDLGTHLYRTQRLREGADLAAVTAEITAAWGLELRILPVTNDRLRTFVTLAEPDPLAHLPAGAEISFQEYFVQRRHAVAISAVRFDGAETATPAPGVLEAIAQAEMVVIAPSNPLVSIAPVLATPGVRAAVAARREACAAISPIVGGAALKGPADRMLRELGLDSSVVAVARLYRDLCSVLVIDEADRSLAGEVEAQGVRAVVTDTIMSTPDKAAALARTVRQSVLESRP
ncbi:MAG: 2-phospho-L-lactate transferase [Acidimicrobiales bacterium]